MPAKGTFDTSISAWLSAMDKAKKIKPGGKLVFINKKTGSAVPLQNKMDSGQSLTGGGAIGGAIG